MRTLFVCFVLVSLWLPVSGHAQGIPGPAESGAVIRHYCTDAWLAGDEAERRLYQACLREQQQAMLRLQELSRRYAGQAFFRDIAIPYCREMQGQGAALNLVLLNFCLDDEVDGFRDIQDLQRRYGSQRVASQARSALLASGSWAAAAGQLKRSTALKTIRQGGTS